MGIFDRLNLNNNKRSVDVITEEGKPFNTTEYTKGLWASAIGARTEGAVELKKLKPKVDEAIDLNSVVARCMDLIVDTLSAIDITVNTTAGEPVEHYLEKIWNDSPNKSQSARLFKKAIWYRIYNHGEAVIILDRGDSRIDEPKSANLFYGNIKVRLTKATAYAPHGEIAYFEIELNKDNWVKLAPSEVIWLREPDPASPWKSRAPMTAALESVGLSRAARGWQAGQLSNGANPGGIVYIGNPETDDDYYFAREEIESALTGPSSAGRIAVSAGPVEPKWIPTSLNAQEVAYLETLKINDEQIANALGVPLDLIGGQRTYENVAEARRIFWEHTLMPKLDIIASELNRQILADTDLYAAFDISNISALQENQNAITERVTKAVNLDIVKIDEARAKLGFDPLPDGRGDLTLSEYRGKLGMSVNGGALPAVAIPAERFLLEKESVALTETRNAVSEIQEKRITDIPQYIRDAAAKGLEYYAEGFAGDGLKDQTVREARDIAEGFMTEDKASRMAAWIARHMVDLDADKNNDPDHPEYPGPGLVAHLLWGSGPSRDLALRAMRWAERAAAEYNKKSTGVGLHTRGLDEDSADKVITNLETQMERVIKRLSEAQLKDAEKRLLRGERENTIPASATVTFNAAAWSERAYEYIIPVITNALEKGAEITSESLDVNLGLEIDNYVSVAAEQRTKLLVDRVNATTAKVLQDKLSAAALADRLSVSEYRAALQETFKELSTTRAEMIARTEMVSSLNGAAREVAVRSNVAMGREWLATRDNRTRDSHEALNGHRTTTMADKYPNGLLYPGDPNGPAKETINCRCVEIYITDFR